VGANGGIPITLAPGLLGMPLTYFAHQLFVLPFKATRPRWFDGTALCIGSMAPDFAYALLGTRFAFASHTASAHLTWSLPVTLLCTRLVRTYLAEPLGAQLPDPVGCEVRALARSVHHWAVTVLSALLGSASHVFVDSFTHRHGWGYDHVAWLHHSVAMGWEIADVLQYVGHTLGSLLGFMLCLQLCAMHRVSAWNGSRHEPSRFPSVPWFWSALSLVAAVCAVIALLLIVRGDSPPVAIMRASYVAFGGLCLVAFSLRREPQVALEP
jgi:hypothetical protein